MLILGGEATGWDLVDRIGALAPSCRVLNHYGPTETTVGAVCQGAEEADRAAATLPIGRPLASSTTQAQIEKQVRASRHRHRPLDIPVHVWHADDSLGRSEPLQDWSRLAPVSLVETIAGTTHRDIVTAPALHRSVRAALETADDGRAPGRQDKRGRSQPDRDVDGQGQS